MACGNHAMSINMLEISSNVGIMTTAQVRKGGGGTGGSQPARNLTEKLQAQNCGSRTAQQRTDVAACLDVR